MLRIGIIGLDSSHCTAFTELLQTGQFDNASGPVRVVAGWPGGSADFPLSISRVAGFTDRMRHLGVQICATPGEILDHVDAVIVGCVDGRVHEQIAKEVFPSGLPVFMDKPLAHQLDAAVRIVELGQRCGTRWFTASALRYQQDLVSSLADPELQSIVSCDVYGTVSPAPGHLELAWYGLHGIEALYEVMGPGCQQVARVRTSRGDVVTGTWSDGRVGTYRGLHESEQAVGFGMVIGSSQKLVQLRFPADYTGLVARIVGFFRGEVCPVDQAETLETFAFMQAAEESSLAGGQSVPLRRPLGLA